MGGDQSRSAADYAESTSSGCAGAAAFTAAVVSVVSADFCILSFGLSNLGYLITVKGVSLCNIPSLTGGMDMEWIFWSNVRDIRWIG